MDLILNVLERAEDQLSENVYFYPPQTYRFWVVVICSGRCRDKLNLISPPPTLRPNDVNNL